MNSEERLKRFVKFKTHICFNDKEEFAKHQSYAYSDLQVKDIEEILNQNQQFQEKVKTALKSIEHFENWLQDSDLVDRLVINILLKNLKTCLGGSDE